MATASIESVLNLGELPNGILETVIRYLTIDEWGILDIALCTHQDVRGIYLQALSSERIQLFVINDDFWNERLDSGILKWIAARKIRVLSWVNSNVNDGILHFIANELPYLQLLDIRDCCIDHCNEITDVGIKAIAKGLRNLQSLYISCHITSDETYYEENDGDLGNFITNEGMTSIASGLSNLNSFHICGRHCNISDVGIGAIVNSLPNLQSLSIIECGITDAVINDIVNKLPNLQVIEISECYNVTGAGTAIIANGNLRYLRSLCIGCTIFNITDTNVAVVTSENLPNLDSLRIEGCRSLTDAGAKSISNGLPNLLSLYVTSCDNITNTGFNHMINGLPKLQLLYIDGHTCKITDSGLAAIANGLPCLQQLGIIGCSEITDVGVSALTTGKFNNNLISLSIGARELSDMAVIAIVNGFPNLQELHIVGRDVTDVSAAVIAKGLNCLQKLGINGCRKISDAGIKEICDGVLHKLHQLDISHCDVSNVGIRAIANSRLSHLRTLYIGYSDTITKKGVKNIGKSLPNLRYLDICECSRFMKERPMDGMFLEEYMNHSGGPYELYTYLDGKVVVTVHPAGL